MSDKVKPPSPRYVGPPKWGGGRTNLPINRLVIHCTVGAEPGTNGAAEKTVSYSKGTSRPSSYHYIADSFKSLQYCYDSYVAYHAPPNEHSIGYELCCSLSGEGKGHWADSAHQKMLRIVAKDAARLCLAYGLPIKKITPAEMKAGKRGICGHNDVRDAWGQTSHWDPGPYFPWPSFIALIQAEADLLTSPPEKAGSRGHAVDHAIADLKKAAAENDNQGPRMNKIAAALKKLLSIRAR